MISWWSVNGCYFSGLFILLCFPVAFVILRKKGYLTGLNDNWIAFIWTFMSTAVFVVTLLFVLQDYGIQEKADRRVNKQVTEAIKDIQGEYDRMMAGQKELFDEKIKLLTKEVEILKTENNIYKKGINETIKDIEDRKTLFDKVAKDTKEKYDQILADQRESFDEVIKPIQEKYDKILAGQKELSDEVRSLSKKMKGRRF